MDEDENRLYVCELPKGYGLFPLKMAIGEVLRDKDALLTIEFVRSVDGKRIDGVAEILLKNDEFARTLMAEGLTIEHKSKMFELKVETQLPHDSTDDHCDTDQEDKKSDDRSVHPVPAPRRFSQQENEVQRQQLRIECRNVHQNMFNRQDMFHHFRQFGMITDLFIPPYLEKTRKPFIKVKYETHESARLAIQQAGNLNELNHKMYLDWDSTEATQIRRRLNFERGPPELSQPMRSSPSHENLFKPNERPGRRNNNNPGRAGDNSNNRRQTNRPKSNSRKGTGDQELLTQTEPHCSKQALRRESQDREQQRTTNRSTSRSQQRKSPEPAARNIKTSSNKGARGGREKSKPVKKRTTRRSSSDDSDDVNDVGSWFELLQRNNKLFRETGNRCVLLQTSPADTTDDSIRGYFFFDKSVNIEHIYHIPDGILLVFDSEKDVADILSENSVEIDDQKIKVFAKTVPKMYEDRLLLKGSFDGPDDVEALLECCEIEDEVSNEIKTLKNSKFLVEFDVDVDIEGILKEIETSDLQEFNPKAFRVCRTDCVKVNNLAKSVKNDAIKLAFMNKKNGGGKVTKVEREGKSTEALVYFADYQDAERIVDRAEENELLVAKKSVDVSLYFQNMSEESEISDSSEESSEEEKYVPAPKPKKTQKQVKRTQKGRTPVQEFEIAPPVDVDIILFVRKSKDGFESLLRDLTGIAELERTEKSSANGMDFKFCFKPYIEDLDDDFKYNQQKFEDKCKNVMNAFFNQFSCKSATYELTNLMNLRRSMLWNEEHDYLKVEVKSKKVVEVYVRWSLTSPGQAKVTGTRHDVTAVLDYLKAKCDIIEGNMSFQIQHFRALRECNVIDGIEKKLQNDVEIKTMEEKKDGSGKVIFKGPRILVEEAKAKMHAAVLELTTRSIPNLGSRSEFLLSALKNDEHELQEGVVDVRQIIQSQFDTDKIYASLQLKQDEVCLKYCEVSELEKAQNALTEIIEQKTIEVTEGFHEVVRTPEWKRLKQNLTNSGSVQIYVNNPKSSIDVVGLTYAFRKAFQQVRDYIEENVIVTKTFEERSFVVQYFKKYITSRKDFNKISKNVKLDYNTGKYNPNVTVKGKKGPVSHVLAWLDEISSDLCIRKRDFNEPGMPKYFKSKKGEDQIETISQKNQCIGVVDPIDVERRTPLARGPARSTVSVRIPDSNINLKLLVCDITTVNYDAIVNTSNEQLELRSGGVSGAILRKDGQSIQAEMNQQLKQNGGKLETGQAVSTGPGSLPFKRIIHTVGPTWGQGNFTSCQQDLRKCVRNCLKEATKHNLSSIAIPAISCGIFGGKAATCVPIIVKAVVDFATNNEDGCLREIGLVEMSKEEIKAEFKKSISLLRNDGDFPSPKPVRRAKPQELPKREGRLKLKVVIGDISTYQTDVVVTSTTPKNLAGCNGSTISKALLKQAGSGLQAACHAASHPELNIGDVVTTPGFSLPCQKVYHVMLSDYNPYNGLIILKKAILKCLDMAEQSGHSSIAFPALGARGFSFPPNEVVKLLDDAVQSHDGTNLQNIDLIVFNSDNNTLKAIQDELAVYPSQPQPTPIPAPVAARNNVQVVVKQGDITATTSKAIVNSTNQFNLSGAVGKALVAKAGQGIVQECANPTISQTPNLRVTSGGNLCQYIIHLNTPKNTNQLENVLVECFREADRLGIKDLAIPPVGTGGIGLQSGPVAKCLASAIDKFDKTNPTNLKKIKVYVFQGNMLPDFQRELVNPATQSPGVFSRLKSAAANALGFTGSSKTEPTPRPISILPTKGRSGLRESVSILFCSWSANDVKKAFDAVLEIVHDQSVAKIIKNEAIEKLSVEEQQELLSIIKKENVIIEKTSNTEITIQGLQKNVLEAYSQAKEIIHEFEQALHTMEYVTWKYVDPNDSTSKDFSLRANHNLEADFRKSEKGKTKISTTLCGKKVQLHIDFSKMEATNTSGNIKSKLERSIASSVDSQLPPTWDDMGGQTCKHVQVSANSPEYQTVFQMFQSGMPGNLVRLDRIQNPTLWRQFQAQKGKIEKKMQNTNVTRQLFHGTDGATCDKIVQHGFDRSYAGKHATAYGRGVYFAVSANYSHGYTQPNRQGNRSMFLAEVVTGAYCRGGSGTNVAPMQSDGSPFDSVVDNVSGPSIFVVFRDASVYPTYLITYK